jgi:nitrate reductase NapD
MQISGVLLHAYPERADSVRERILQIPGAEVHAVTQDGRIVVTLEQEHDEGLAQILQQMTDIPGVLASALVYHYFDPDEGQEA